MDDLGSVSRGLAWWYDRQATRTEAERADRLVDAFVEAVCTWQFDAAEGWLCILFREFPTDKGG